MGMLILKYEGDHLLIQINIYICYNYYTLYFNDRIHKLMKRGECWIYGQ